jgi:hypothetical protein
MDNASDVEPMIEYDFDPRNLPPDFLSALGLAAAAAAQTEDVMQHLIGGLAGLDIVQTIAVAAQMSATLKDQVARALAELSAPHLQGLDDLDDLLDVVNDAMERRNALLHNAYCRHPHTGEIMTCRQRARGAVRVSTTPITAAEVEADAVAIYNAGMGIMTFMISHGIGQIPRDGPIYRPVDRGQKARNLRKTLRGKGSPEKRPRQ